MKYYTVAELNVTDRAWVKDYVVKVSPMVERYGGRYLARTPNMERLEGERSNPQLLVIIEWPTREAATSFYESPEYAPYLQSRKAGSTGEFLLVPGEDVNNRPAKTA